MNARSLRELPFLFLRFFSGLARQRSKTKMPRQVGDIHLSGGERGISSPPRRLADPGVGEASD